MTIRSDWKIPNEVIPGLANGADQLLHLGYDLECVFTGNESQDYYLGLLSGIYYLFHLLQKELEESLSAGNISGMITFLAGKIMEGRKLS